LCCTKSMLGIKAPRRQAWHKLILPISFGRSHHRTSLPHKHKMPPRLNLLSASRALPIRPKASTERWRSSIVFQGSRFRSYADSSKDLPVSSDEKGPNTDQAPHVSEEAAATAKVMGEDGPDLNQGTPLEEIVAGDKEAQEHLPKVVKDALKGAKPSGTRSFSTSAFRRQDKLLSGMQIGGSVDAVVIGSGTSVMTNPPTQEPARSGVKFGLPALPLPSELNLHHRYDPLIEQFTGLLIQHGKKGVAQRVRPCRFHIQQ
jgi:small subunit ribosomal protein S7